MNDQIRVRTERGQIFVDGAQGTRGGGFLLSVPEARALIDAIAEAIARLAREDLAGVRK